jgi:glycosyltransferase involved in cell wall biosynthesis
MIVFLFWTALVLIIYTYIGYPLFIYLVSRVRSNHWVKEPLLANVSIIMAVHNGVATLEDRINDLLELDYPDELVELLIVSDGSTDGTREILKSVRNPRVRTWVLEEHAGKAVALNLAIRHATGEILLFVDSRPRLEKQALAKIMSNFSDPHVGAVAGELFLRGEAGDSTTEAVGSLYWRYEQWIRTCEALVDSAVGVYGGFYAIRRILATELPPGTILDDMFQPLNVIRRGYRSVLDQEARVFDTWPVTGRGEFTRKVRTLAGNFQLFERAPWLLTRENRVLFELVSHKLMRLVVPFCILVTFSASALLVVRPFYAAMFGIQTCIFLLGIVGWKINKGWLRRLSGPAAAFLMLNAAVLVGLYRHIKEGDQLWKIWISPGTKTTMP